MERVDMTVAIHSFELYRAGDVRGLEHELDGRRRVTASGRPGVRHYVCKRGGICGCKKRNVGKAHTTPTEASCHRSQDSFVTQAEVKQ